MNEIQGEMKVNVPSGCRWDKELQKSLHEALPYYVENFRSATFNEDSLSVTTSKPIIFADHAISKIEKLISDLSRNFRDTSEVVIQEFVSAGTMSLQDPFPILVERKEVISTGHGKFVYRGDFNRAFEGLDNVLRRYCFSQGASPETYPTTVQTQTLLDSGYLKLHPHLAFLAAPIQSKAESLAAFSKVNLGNNETTSEVVALMGMPEQTLAPTVCYHTFESRRHAICKNERITSLNKCHRHEPVNVQSLSRLTTYWMREIVAFDEDQVLQSVLDHALNWTVEFLQELDVSFSVISANDPFFATEGAGNRVMQSAFMLKREIKVPVTNGEKIAIASFNHHQKSLSSKFMINNSVDTSENASSCCVGWGFERFLYAIYSRHGAEISQWSLSARQLLELEK